MIKILIGIVDGTVGNESIIQKATVKEVALAIYELEKLKSKLVNINFK